MHYVLLNFQRLFPLLKLCVPFSEFLFLSVNFILILNHGFTSQVPFSELSSTPTTPASTPTTFAFTPTFDFASNSSTPASTPAAHTPTAPTSTPPGRQAL